MTAQRPMVETLAGSWLALQCQMIPQVYRGAVYLAVNETDNPSATASWPEGSNATPALNAASQLVIDRKCPVLCGDEESAAENASENYNIACPLIVEGRFSGVVAVTVANASEQQQRAVMQLLQWGSTWLEFLVNRESSSVTKSLMTATRVVATSLEHQHFQAAAMAAATELAIQLSCERVAIALRTGSRPRLRALSNNANFDAKSNLAAEFEALAEEALTQGNTVNFPAEVNLGFQLSEEHEKFSRANGGANLCTVPIGEGDELFGAIIFERTAEFEFDSGSIELCEATASLLGPILELKRKESRWLGAVVRDEIFRYAGKVFGRGHIPLKLLLVALLVVAGFCAFVNGEYRITAKAAVEGTVQRAVVAPMDGFIANAITRAGDLVRAGEVLCRLEDNDLKLEMARWQAQHAQYKTEYRQALVKRDRAQTQVLNAQIAQAAAQLQLIEDKLQRTVLIAPFDGVVVSGDLSQQFGSPVERGAVLFEVAPLDSYRVVLDVDEREIADLRVGQSGKLAMSALSGDVFPIEVTRITPVSNPSDGRNAFRVEAKINQASSALRPGMQGIGKVTVGERKIYEILTHKLLSAAGLWLWSITG